MVASCYEEFSGEDAAGPAGRLEAMWRVLGKKGLAREGIIQNGLLAPVTCNLLNPDKTVTVEKSFALLRELSLSLREKYLK